MSKYERGQRVLRDMGDAAGHWVGVVITLPGERIYPDIPTSSVMPPGRIVVQFGGREGIGIGFDEDDPHLLPAPDDLTQVAERDAARAGAWERKWGPIINKPQWTEGDFGPIEALITVEDSS